MITLPDLSADAREVLAKLEDNGYGWLLAALLEEDSWTKKGRLKVSGVCRHTGRTPGQVGRALADCRLILSAEAD